jgi:hypothetical protein
MKNYYFDWEVKRDSFVGARHVFTMLGPRYHPLRFSSLVSIVPKGILLENDLAFMSTNKEKFPNCSSSSFNNLNH